MEPVDSTIHAFVIRLWLERTDVTGEKPALRGHITHLPDGVRCTFQSTQEIVTFIETYLKALGRLPE